jgi:hypothetical protein
MKKWINKKNVGRLFLTMACMLFVETSSADCYNVTETGLCASGSLPNCAQYLGYTCGAASYAATATSFTPNTKGGGDEISTGGCQQYEICVKVGQPVKTCWGPADGSNNNFSSACPKLSA